MATSIGKLSKSFFVKLLVGIIILPFVFWGMGDVFRGGNQNVIATIDSKKVSTQEFVNYLNRLNFLFPLALYLRILNQMSFHSKPTMRLVHPRKKYKSYLLGSPFSHIQNLILALPFLKDLENLLI